MSQDPSTYPCPCDVIRDGDNCSRTFSTENGAVMHALNKGGDYHSVVESKPDAYEALQTVSVESESDESSQDPGDSEEGGSSASLVSEPEIPEPEGADDEAECPQCGAGLDATEEEVAAFIEEHGQAFCGECGTKMVMDDA